MVYDPVREKWGGLPGVKPADRGLPSIGSRVYAEHPSTDVLTLSYDLRDGHGVRRWRPGEALPLPLFDYLAGWGLIEAHNVMFEWLIWSLVCVPRYGFPPLNPYQLRCSMATARVNSYPGALGDLSDVLRLPVPKDADGKRLLKKFSEPQNPTKKQPALWIQPEDDPADFEKLRAYCDQDNLAEQGAAARMQPMSDDELTFWFVDQEINRRGMAVDRPAIRACVAVLEQALDRYGDEFQKITGLNPTQLQAVGGWLAAKGVSMPSMDADAVSDALAHSTAIAPHPPGGINPVRRVLEIRELIGSASVKKLFAMENQAGRENRLYNLFVHHGARTGRPTGQGPQPLNLPRDGPELVLCGPCRRPYRPALDGCPWCAAPRDQVVRTDSGKELIGWTIEYVDAVLEIMALRSLELVEWYFGDALLCISGCLRGLFVAGPGMELIASDYSAIEAVVIACLSGEQWRIEAFQKKQPIYLVGASKITGRSLDWYLDYAAQNGKHHQDRQDIGKISELACGFGGWVGSYKAFGSKEDDATIKAQILAWREASPAIVEFWGGQYRGMPWDKTPMEYYGVEGAFIQAVRNPGTVFDFRGLKFFMRDTPAGTPALIIRLLSGRELTYHQPRLVRRENQYSRGAHPDEVAITYWTWNTDRKKGAYGWCLMETYGGRLTENIVQATAHCIQRYGILKLRAAGYHIVLHVYDEDVAEVPLGTGTIEEFERLMSEMPPWAVLADGSPWPISASGGWRGYRYRKG